jgi:acyl-[acyl-carrier-protein]-phospholipid O-acyltransferase/long-chain-fatty-acid--[acyl-carrier-protein] ligase
MAHNQFNLLTTRRFMPIFLSQFFGAFNDNVYKNGILLLITYRMAVVNGIKSEIFITIGAGLFILPFLLFSATAGQVADKYRKSSLISYIQFIKIIIMLIGSYAIINQNIVLMLFVLFCLGTQSAFFGPLKFSIIPESLEKEELIGGNALIESGTFLAILLGTITGGLLMSTGEYAPFYLAFCCFILSVFGWYSSTFIPQTEVSDPELVVSKNIFRETLDIVNTSKKNHVVYLSILGTSWFWLIGATMLTQFPIYADKIIGGNETIVTLFLTLFSLGISIGCMLCNKLLKGEISPTYVPIGILLITFFLVDLYFASKHFQPLYHHKIGIGEFLLNQHSWRIIFDLLLLSISSGIYIVPLYAIMQYHTKEKFRSRIIGASNIINSVYIAMSSIIAALLYMSGFSVLGLFLFLGITNGFVALYICKILPDALIRSVLRMILKTIYRVEVIGKENYYAAGRRALIIANHTSFLDGLLLIAFLPEKVTFAISPLQARRWWIKPLLNLVRTFSINPAEPMKTKTLIKEIRRGMKVVIFPEGRLTETGSLMKIYEGPGMIADRSDALILPIRIDGAQYSIFSRLRGKLRTKLFPKIVLTMLEPVKFQIPEQIAGRERRIYASKKLYHIMSEMIFLSSDYKKTLFQSLIDAKNLHGVTHKIVEDIQRKQMGYQDFICRSFVLGSILSIDTKYKENVGLMMPNTTVALIAFFGLQAYSRVPAMINFTTGANNIIISTKAANVTKIITSRKFILTAGLDTLVDKLKEADLKIIYLEDYKKGFYFFDKFLGFTLGLMPSLYYDLIQRIEEIKNKVDFKNPNYTRHDKAAVVLFTSGSEGTPKGVALSHSNLLANCYQLLSILAVDPSDKIMNVLPIFHTFGLTGGVVLPIMSGMKVFQYPSPLHYRVIPEMIYDTDTTIFFATDTFLSGYAKYAHPYDFYSIKYVFAGAEKLKDETKKQWAENFGVRIFEGYGCTETSPAISINTPMLYKQGSVGKSLPGTMVAIDKVDGIDVGGKLLISGPNIMLGYYTQANPGIILFPENKFNDPNLKYLKGKWYDTGDIVDIDSDGYLKIVDRVKRFAKIAGEMVSLMAVEGYISELYPEFICALIAIPDDKKGEQLVLITNNTAATKLDIAKFFKTKGYAEIAVPKDILILEELPLLGSGKVDYVRLKEYVLNNISQEQGVVADDE